MKKIGLDVRMWNKSSGGIGRYCQNLVKELAKIDQENQYTVILTPERVKEFQSPSSNFKPLVAPIEHYSLSEQREFNKILNQEQFDLVHFTNFNHPIMYRRPFVVTIHDLIMHYYPTGAQRNSVLRRIAYKLVMSDNSRAKRIIVPSLSTKRDLIKDLGFSEKNITVTTEGSEEIFRVHSQEEKRRIQQKLELPERFILFVSRWEKYKGLPELITAFESVSAENPELGLVICGSPSKQNPDIAEIVSAAQAQNPNIITPGFVSDEDLAPLYSAATVYVHPSWYEGFGIMILEAFASGVPVITSNVSSLPEIVGEAGLLVDPKDPEDIADKIKIILNDEKIAKRLIESGLQRVKEFSWAKMARETLAIYQEVIK